MKITAAVAVEAFRPLVLQEVELADDLGPNEVLVKNVATGICHTDIALRDAPADSVIGRKPYVYGHEGSGLVEKIGSAVTAVKPGDAVVMIYYSDGTCASCLDGQEAYCEQFSKNNFSGVRIDGRYALHSLSGEPIAAAHHQQSSFATYSIATDRNVIKAPNDIPLELLGPLGCGFLTGGGAVRNRLKPRAGASFAMFGMGALGFAAIHMAKKAGCSPIIAIDLHEGRLELAKAFGATHTVNASKTSDTVAELRAICPGGVDYTYEAAGSTKVMNQAIQVLAKHGTCLISGVVTDPSARLQIAPTDLMSGLTIGGVLLGDGDPAGVILELIEDIRAGAFPIERLVRMYDFKEINVAIEDALSGEVIKPILRLAD